MARAWWGIVTVFAIAASLWACAPRATPPASTVFGTTQAPPPAPATGTPGVTAGTGTLEGRVYLLPENTNALPDFATLRPIGSVYTSKLDIPVRSFTEGFPGITDRFEWFAIDYRGTCQFDPGGKYTFKLSSDDGTKLYIDDKLVLDNDFIHGLATVTGSLEIAKGPHRVRLSYFQGPREEIGLQLFVTPPGGQEQVFVCR